MAQILNGQIIRFSKNKRGPSEQSYHHGLRLTNIHLYPFIFNEIARFSFETIPAPLHEVLINLLTTNQASAVLGSQFFAVNREGAINPHLAIFDLYIRKSWACR